MKVLPAFCPVTSRASRIDASSRVLLIGDSHAELMQSRMKRLAGGTPFLSIAKSGTRIDQWATSKRLTETLRSFKPSIVLISLGSNDEEMGKGFVPRSEKALSALVKQIEATGARILWVGAPTLPFKLSGSTAMIEKHIPAEDYFDSKRMKIPRNSGGVHATPAGLDLWSRAIWCWL